MLRFWCPLASLADENWLANASPFAWLGRNLPRQFLRFLGDFFGGAVHEHGRVLGRCEPAAKGPTIFVHLDCSDLSVTAVSKSHVGLEKRTAGAHSDKQAKRRVSFLELGDVASNDQSVVIRFTITAHCRKSSSVADFFRNSVREIGLGHGDPGPRFGHTAGKILHHYFGKLAHRTEIRGLQRSSRSAGGEEKTTEQSRDVKRRFHNWRVS